MTDMKCPFCQQELEYCGTYIDGTKKLWCDNCKLFGDNRLFEKLIRTRKALDVAKDTFNWIDETYRTGQETEAEIWGKVQLAAQEITVLEQKEEK